jgi:conjugal transfer pilin signal peptidase TrbI
LYWIERDVTPKKGELVAFYPPANPRYPGRMWFVKVIRGVEGDCVSKRGGDHGAQFQINGETLAWAKPETLKGEPLLAGPTGCLPAGKIFVWTPHPDSYDSRYAEIGWIDQSRVSGRAHRVL